MGRRILRPLCGATAMALLIPVASWQLAAGQLQAPAEDGGRGAVDRVEAGSARVGSSSCSGRGCHGKVAPQGTGGSEFNTWARLDPHAGAFLTLFDCRSESIQRNLSRSNPAEAYVPPYRDALCKGCHGDADNSAAVLALGRVDCAEPGAIGPAIGPSGVGCESCHGAASSWLDVHYRDGWRERDPDAASTMQPLAPTAEKAGVCLRCHVGVGLDQEVNHDLIAAGHPRLNFELASALDRLPRHWDESAVAADRAIAGLPPRTPAGEWGVGQVETLRAALALLAERAGRSSADREPPWPEFTEYACFSCHHALVDEGLHYSRASAVPGALPWGSWTVPMGRAVLGRAASPLADRLDAIHRLMQEPFPDRHRVAAEAASLASDLGRPSATVTEGTFRRDDLRALLVGIASEPGRFEAMTANWDAAAQLYLACRALIRSEAEAMLAAGTASGSDLRAIRVRFAALDAARLALDFPGDDLDSPGSGREPNPWAEDPRPVVAALRALLDAAVAGG